MSAISRVGLIMAILAAAGCGGEAGPAGPDTVRPSVTLSGPPQGGVTGILDLTAIASDDHGVTRIRFLVNGGMLADVSSPPWVVHWNSDVAPAANYVFRAIAYDAAGNSDTSAALTYSHGLPTSSLKVVVSTTGVEPDSDGYTLTFLGVPHLLPDNDSTVITPLLAGLFPVTLSGVPNNCEVVQPLPVNLSFTVNTTTRLALTVACVNHLSTVHVKVHTTGRQVDADGYFLSVDGGQAQSVSVNGTLNVPGVTPGSHTFTLSGMAANCAALTALPAIVDVSPLISNQVDLDARCLGALAGRILFGESGYLWSANPDGSGREQITLSPADFVASPSVSQDGKVIVYLGVAGLRMVNADGTEPRTVASAGVVNPANPALSPDGTIIAFDAQSKIWIVDTGGAQVVDLNRAGTYPCWSPDASQIGFSSGGTVLAIMQADGTGLTSPFLQPISGEDCDWSPDGTTIAYRGIVGGAIYTVHTSGQTPVPVRLPNAGYVGHPRWSPDGTHLAYQVSTGNGLPMQVWVMQADGNGATSVSNSALIATSPAWGH